MDEARPILREEQLFRSHWTGRLMLGGALVMAGVLGTSFYQLRCAAPAEQRMPPWFIWILMGLMVVVNIALFYLSWRGGLVTEILPDGIAVQFNGLTKRHYYPWEEIAEIEARRYHPIREYGGWGIRGLGKNRAYNVSGNEGLQLTFTNGKRLLLGSQMAWELEAAARAARGES